MTTDITDFSSQEPTKLIGQAHKVTSEEGHVYEPWTDGWAVGFRVTHGVTGVIRYVYLNPSSSDNPTGDATVFVYQGEAGDGAVDPPIIYVDAFNDDAVSLPDA